MIQEPWQLVCPPCGIGLVWSPKSACTSAVLWYLAHAGLLEAALAFDPWPHRYRTQVLPGLPAYQQWVRGCEPGRLRWVRVIRNPFLRAVSSYRHALRHGYEDRRIDRVLGLSVAGRGFSFGEFLRYLEQIDVTTCDPHHAQQWRSFEAGLRMDRVVHADREPLLETLCEFADPGPELRRRLFAEAARLAEGHHARRVASNEDCLHAVLTPSDTSGPWPDYGAFLNQEARSRIERIYRRDFEQFGRFL